MRIKEAFEITDRAAVAKSALSLFLFMSVSSTAAQTLPSVLPRGSSFGDVEEAFSVRTFQSETQTGKRSAESRLGELLFESPRLLGGLAREIGMSCDTCHIRGGSNPDFFIPGSSTNRGTFNRAPELFNPSAHVTAVKAIRIPSLVGSVSQTRFGHDGRSSSMKDFVREVITDEFSGASPSTQILDYLIAYISDLEVRPNSRLTPKMAIINPTMQEKHGEDVFNKPFAGYANGCATCHLPLKNFSDQLFHKIGDSRVKLRTSSLLDRVDGLPYFHDGRALTRKDAIAHKNKDFAIGLTEEDQNALAAYLAVIETGGSVKTTAKADQALADIASGKEGLKFALTTRDKELIAIAADGFARKLQILADRYDSRLDEAEEDRIRTIALSAITDSALAAFQLRSRAEEDQLDGADIAFQRISERLDRMHEPVMRAEPYSLFNIERLRTYRAQLGIPCLNDKMENDYANSHPTRTAWRDFTITW